MALGALGVGLGVSLSIKWVGLFTIAWIGLYTIVDLWSIWGDRSVPLVRVFSFAVVAVPGPVANNTKWPRLFIRQLRVAANVAARALTLIFLPLAIYVASFWAHFAVLTNTGPGDATMPSLFSANLAGSPLASQPRGTFALQECVDGPKQL